MPDDKDILLELETSLLKTGVRRDPAALEALFAPEFREFASSGRVYNRSEIIAALQSQSPAEIELTNYSASFPAADVALVTYTAKRAGARSSRSSLWVRREGRWQMLFHQGTPRE